MHKVVAMAELYPVVEEALSAGGSITLTSTGTSMLPMLRHQRDAVILERAAFPLRVNDVALYRRANGQFVLHRVVGMGPDGGYMFCGDNQFLLEHHIAHRQVIGRMRAFTRGGHRISCDAYGYKAYVFLLPALRRLRRGLLKCRRLKVALKRRLQGLIKGKG